MKLRNLALGVAALVVTALPALAQDTINTVNYNGIGFQFDSALATNVDIRQFPGDPVDLEQPGGPEVAHTEFVLYSGVETPTDTFSGVGTIRVYDSASFTGYEQASFQLANLQNLVAARPDLALNMVATEDNSVDLPFMPVFPASQVVRGQAHYIDTPAVSGVAYIAAYRQDVSPLTANEFWYTFQGLTADGATYVSAVFPVSASAFPAEIAADYDYDALSADYLGYLNESIALLNSAAPSDFTPDISTLDALVQTITLPGNVVEPPVDAQPTLTAPEGPAPTEDMSGQNPSLGGLAGTWRLVQYGDPNAPTPVVEGSEITVTFATDGLSGNGGCNTYGGAFVYEGNTVTISGIVSTLRACVDEAVTAQESAYFTALGSVTGFQVGDATLQLFYSEGVLVFQAV